MESFSLKKPIFLRFLETPFYISKVFEKIIFEEDKLFFYHLLYNFWFLKISVIDAGL